MQFLFDVPVVDSSLLQMHEARKIVLQLEPEPEEAYQSDVLLLVENEAKHLLKAFVRLKYILPDAFSMRTNLQMSIAHCAYLINALFSVMFDLVLCLLSTFVDDTRVVCEGTS